MRLTAQRLSTVRTTAWTALPQITTRLVSFYVFAVVAHQVDADTLGAFTLGVAISGIAVPMAPAIIGRPLANTRDQGDRAVFGRLSTSAAIWMAVGGAVVLALVAIPLGGLTRVALLGGAIGLPSTMTLEATFWRSLFLESRRTAATWYAGGYLLQALLVTAVAFGFGLDGETLVLVYFGCLALPALAQLLRAHDLPLSAAVSWVGTHRSRWWPYVVGTFAGLGLVQAIPIVLSATSGFADAGVYRAGELSFGAANLAVGVAVQILLVRPEGDERRTYVVSAGLLLAVTLANAALIWLLPRSVLELLFGPVTPVLMGVFWLITIQRAATTVSTVGSVLLVSHLSAKRAGLLDVGSAAVSLVALVVGALALGLRGGVGGLAVAEIVLAIIAAYLLRRTRART